MKTFRWKLFSSRMEKKNNLMDLGEKYSIVMADESFADIDSLSTKSQKEIKDFFASKDIVWFGYFCWIHIIQITSRPVHLELFRPFASEVLDICDCVPIVCGQ